MPASLFIAGTGSYAAEIAGWAGQSDRPAAGLIEMRDPTRVGSEIHGLPVIAAAEPPPGAVALIGVGDDRTESWALLSGAGWSAAEALVHPGGNVDPSARLGVGATVGPLAVIGALSAIGANALVSRGALVGHHVTVGDCATIGPGANVGGNTTLGSSAFLGIGCVISNGLSVGAGAVIGAGAVVVRDVEPGVRVQGVPARPYP